MKPFSVDDIHEVFRKDLADFTAATRQGLTRYCAPGGVLDDVQTAAVCTHAIKGVSAMVGAWGLSYLCEDFEVLYEVLGSLHRSEPDSAREMALFILESAPATEQMARLTLAGQLEEAHDIYRRIRITSGRKFHGYLPTREEFTEAAAEAPPRFQPQLGLAGGARRIAPPMLKLAGDEPAALPNLTEPPAPPVTSPTLQVMAMTSSAAGTARRVSPPPLKLNTSPELDKMPEQDLAGRAESSRPLLVPRAPGFARSLVKPALKIAIAPPENDSADLSQSSSAADLEFQLIFETEAGGYLQDLVPVLEQLAAGITTDEPWSAVRRIFHTLKGSAAMVGAAEVSDVARLGEALARVAEEKPAARIPRRVARLERVAKRIAALLSFSPAAATTPPPRPTVAAIRGGLDPEFVHAFLSDAEEQINSLELALLAWERHEEPEAQRNAAFRAYHTLKGAANSIGLQPLGTSLHAAEAFLEDPLIRDAQPSAESFQFLFGTVDKLREFSVNLASNPAAEWRGDWSRSAGQLTGAADADASADARREAELQAELIQAFAFDAREQAVQCEAEILAWERGDDPAPRVFGIFRAFHTLKGAANSVGLRSFGADCHAAEGLLDRLSKSGQVQPVPEIVTFLLSAVDQIAHFGVALDRDLRTAWAHEWQHEVEQLKALITGPDESATASPAESDDLDAAPVAVDYIRVDAARVRKLLNQVGELVIERHRFGAKLERATELRQLLGGNRQRLLRLVESFQDTFEYSSSRPRFATGSAPAFSGAGLRGDLNGSTAADEFSELEFDRYDELNMHSRALAEVADDLGQVTVELERLIDSFHTDEKRFGIHSKVMQEDITTLTSQPIFGLFHRLERTFRDAVQSEKKDAVLRFERTECTLDRAILERLHGPLLHLLRNAVAHGIEQGEERIAGGKPRQGVVTLAARQSGNQVIVTVQDDGAGVSPERVLARARQRNLIGPEITELSGEAVLELLFTPGFSTADDISSISGRGVGLDVVKQEVEAMKGSIALSSTPGEGTTWTLQLPLTLAVSEAIIIEVAGQEYALPLNHVVSGLLLNPAGISVRAGVEWYRHAGEDLRVIRMDHIFRTPDAERGTRGVIISVGEVRAVLVVDRVPARREIVVKGFDPLLAQHPFLEGATLDDEGRPLLILSVAALLGAATEIDPTLAGARDAATSRPGKSGTGTGRLTALVVDDSLSVRLVQDRLLTDLGCDVVLANDGLDAIEKLRLRIPDIIFTDLEMPRMNGYDLISTVRTHPTWAHIPMVLVTSRAAQKHLDKALHLGANSFLTKPFSQADLAKQLAEHVSSAPR
ncbi:MAG TPA: Hpt domain-containing protein [Chthoniobacteraceae bacterium]|jgi:chemosensory pili system protein ChpA (sensor histidine kinase/response regulator)